MQSVTADANDFHRQKTYTTSHHCEITWDNSIQLKNTANPRDSVGNCSRPQGLVTALYFLFFFSFFSLVRRTCRKKAKETRAIWRPSGLRGSRFLSKRAGRSSKRTSAPGMSKTILLPSSPLQRGAVGDEVSLLLLSQTTPAHFL